MGDTALTEFLLSDTSAAAIIGDRRSRAILERIAVCRTIQLGGRILHCTNCGTRVVYYNACHQRGCPRCCGSVQSQWKRRMQHRLLHVRHIHLTFSGPDKLTQVWRSYPKAVIDSLFAAVNKTLKLAAHRAELQPGVILIFHSHGTGMSYKAHLHGMITAGGVDGEGEWKLNSQYGERRLREDFHRLINDELAKRIPAKDASELQREPFECWKVYENAYHDNAEKLIGYFGRTRHGVVIKPDESFVVSERSVQFATHHSRESKTTTLSREEFLNRYFAHIPPKGAVTVRHYGLYATRYGHRLESIRSMLENQYHQEPHGEPEEPLEPCPVCDHVLRTAISFSRDELPPILRYAELARGSPLAHGELIEQIRFTA